MKPTDERFVQINAIEQECFHGSWTADTLLSELNSPLNILVTEERGGIVAGFALGRVAADEAELFQIATLPEFRRQGIAERLLSELHAKARERGAVCCFLEVRSQERRGDSAIRKERLRKDSAPPELLPGRRRGDIPQTPIKQELLPESRQQFCVL